VAKRFGVSNSYVALLKKVTPPVSNNPARYWRGGAEMKTKLLAVAGLTLAAWFCCNAASVGEYIKAQTAPNSTEAQMFRMYIFGVGDGFTIANGNSLVTNSPPLYCRLLAPSPVEFIEILNEWITAKGEAIKREEDTPIQMPFFMR
jgi:hypothetical protein